jgi:hypothetical protein
VKIIIKNYFILIRKIKIKTRIMNSSVVEKLSKLSKFGMTSPIECYKLNIIAVYCMILLVLSLIFNTMLIIIFARHKKLRTPLNMFILTLTILNLFGSIIEFSFVIPSNLACRYLLS